MTIGGIAISEAKFIALSALLERGKIPVVVNGGIHRRTASSLMADGLIEMFVPDATTFSMAARGRVRYYRLTAAGEEAIRGVKRRYKR
jgi:hypothetical protein